MCENETTGQYLYAAGDAETRNWFHRQWAIWPERADERLTTNLAFHRGAMAAYEIERGEKPHMSAELKVSAGMLDRLASPPQ
jgi:hypothetical protein